MPKDTFFNLDKVKREKIICSSIKEFSRVPFDQTSIKNIVNDAGIPRGSFYQYFVGKEDAYKYVIGEVISRKHKNMAKMLKQNDGDIFAAFEEAFISEFEIFKRNEFHNLIKNFITCAKPGLQSEVFLKKLHHRTHLDEKNSGETGRVHREILDLINKDLYSFRTDNSFIVLIGILVKAMGETLLAADASKMGLDKALEQYREVAKILKYGALKKDIKENSV